MGKFTKEEKRRRTQLLMEQSILHDKYCWECPRLQYYREEKRDTGSQTPDKLCEGCQVYTRLREIGTGLSNSGRKSEEEVKLEKRSNLTKEIYLSMKEKDITDKDIMSKFGIPKGSWYGIKKKLLSN